MVYSGIGDYKKSEIYFNRAINLSNETSNTLSEAINTAGLGKMYLEMAKDKTHNLQRRKLLQKAISNILLGLDVFKSFGDYRRYQEFSEDLSEAYELLGDYNNALKVYKVYSYYKDSLFSDKSSKALARQEISYEFSKREDSIRLQNEKEIEIRDATLVANQRQKWMLFGGILLLSIIGVLLYYQNQIRKKNNEKLSILNEELNEANQIKAKFFSILNHDMRSPLSNIIKLLKIQQNSHVNLDEATKRRLENETIHSTENLLDSMEDLLLWSKGQMEKFEPKFSKIDIVLLFEDLKIFYENVEGIHFKFEATPNQWIYTDENYLKTIMRNLTSNAIKVLRDQLNAEIVWKSEVYENEIILSITDNGPGSSNESFRALYDDTQTVGIKTGLGLHLVRDMAKAIHCQVEVNSLTEKETTIRLVFAS